MESSEVSTAGEMVGYGFVAGCCVVGTPREGYELKFGGVWGVEEPEDVDYPKRRVHVPDDERVQSG